MSHPLPRYTDWRAQDERRLARILLETGTSVPSPTTVQRATLAGDERRLRGIPVCARGVPGVSPGTHPETITHLRTIR